MHATWPRWELPVRVTLDPWGVGTSGGIPALSPRRETVPRCSAKASCRVRLIGPNSISVRLHPRTGPPAALLYPLPLAPAPPPTQAWRGPLLQTSRDTQATSMENAAQADICVLVSYLLSAPRSPSQGPTSLTAAAQSGVFAVVLSVSVADDGGERGPGEPCAASGHFTPFHRSAGMQLLEPRLAGGPCHVCPRVGLFCCGCGPVGPPSTSMPRDHSVSHSCDTQLFPVPAARPPVQVLGREVQEQLPIFSFTDLDMRSVTPSEDSSSRTPGFSGGQVGGHCSYQLIAQRGRYDMKRRELMVS